MIKNEPVFSVTDFVAVFNQTLEFAYPSVVIVGELANFKVSKNRWVYFDLKDETASVKFFGTVYNLPGPLEDGLLLQVRAVPRLHPQFGFSLNIQTIQPVGEGSLKRAAQLLEAKLRAEGLFEPDRKRPLPYPPTKIGLITSAQSAAYKDFVKITDQRWGGLQIELVDVQVQGDIAVVQIIEAIDLFNQQAQPPEVLVITRGGGSADDLAVFNTEQITRAVAASRIPTLLAIGHEIDLSLAELAADLRASTPSNAAELLVPDRQQLMDGLVMTQKSLADLVRKVILANQTRNDEVRQELTNYLKTLLLNEKHYLVQKTQLLSLLNPREVLKRGYSIIRQSGKTILSVQSLKSRQPIEIELHDGSVQASITSINNH